MVLASNEPIIVSVIVPARNEEACLGLCLQSLKTQTGITFEIIVVDDASTDRTPEIAKSFVEHGGSGSPANRDLAGVTIIPAPPLPENWTGKNNAMAAGAKIAKGKWLLFTDADTFHKPGSLARAVAEAEEHGVALLSYSPEQEVRTFLERAVMPVIFAELAATYPPAKVRDSNSPIAAANGQYLMISREAYDAVGGHTKIASDLLEDVAMSRLVKSSGRKIRFRYGGDAVRTRMYRSWPQMKEGWTKNLALLFPKPAELAGARAGEFLLMLLLASYFVQLMLFISSIVAGRILRVPARGWLHWYVLGVVSFSAVVAVGFSLRFVRRIKRAQFSFGTTGWSALGLPVFAYLLLRSHRAYRRARFDWKDRRYVYSADEVKNMTRAPSSQK